MTTTSVPDDRNSKRGTFVKVDRDAERRLRRLPLATEAVLIRLQVDADHRTHIVRDSIRSLADDWSLPWTTVRDHVRALIAAGEVERLQDGTLRVVHYLDLTGVSGEPPTEDGSERSTAHGGRSAAQGERSAAHVPAKTEGKKEEGRSSKYDQSKDSKAVGGQGRTSAPAASGDQSKVKVGSGRKTQSEASSPRHGTDPSTASVVDEDLVEDILDRDWSDTGATMRFVRSILATCLTKYPEPLVREVSRSFADRWTPEYPNQRKDIWLDECEDRLPAFVRKEWDSAPLYDDLGPYLAPEVKRRAIAQGIRPPWHNPADRVRYGIDSCRLADVALPLLQSDPVLLDRWALFVAENDGCALSKEWESEHQLARPLDQDGLCADCSRVSTDDRERAARVWQQRQEDVRQAVQGGEFPVYACPTDADLQAWNHYPEKHEDGSRCWRCTDEEEEPIDTAAAMNNEPTAQPEEVRT
jgi:hypothetical protein